ncbi:hypothetical protein OEZ71_17525 [Defluviimonas sp. WL0050]|uniref:Lipoprotein n=1 Tax=Albidovulum litorale TaxID=2984134 RepID=A0ABT2ZSH2_9RHOB|nr:hypothetical protein [Defluviimonas sp. WL0050]MCV2874101.1 hypothetical protein [Defluviimonas sp. WL0050]
MRFVPVLLAAAALLSACAQPRAHVGARITPDGVRATPSLSTSIAGIGLTLSQ